MTTSESASQPESLDLDYDMWQGQFEFVGINKSDKNSSQQLKNSDSLEDLNFNLNNNNIQRDYSKPILIDEETFLSLQPQDFDDITTISGPNSTIFIEQQSQQSSTFDTNNKILNNKENLIINNNNSSNKLNNNLNNNKTNLINNNNCYKIENLKNYKNKLVSDFNEKSIINPQSGSIGVNNNNKMNGFTAEICDNLNEQVSVY